MVQRAEGGERPKGCIVLRLHEMLNFVVGSFIFLLDVLTSEDVVQVTFVYGTKLVYTVTEPQRYFYTFHIEVELVSETLQKNHI